MYNILPHILNFGKLFFFYDDDDEDERMYLLPKMINYAEEVVPRFPDHQFQRHFRMLPDTFENLLEKIHNVQSNEIKRGHPEVSLEKQCMVTLWYLENLESFRLVADRFGISKSSSWAIMYRTSMRLMDVNARYGIISWPSAARATEIMHGFSAINNFPGVIGAIDGTHIPINKPKEYGNSYINRKGYPSILLQGVCDNNKLFIDVYAGQPGSIHDAKLFKRSDLYARIERGDIEFPVDAHLIGDLAYKLTPYLMVGFKNVGNLTPAQIRYNIKLSQVRVIIENAFALLKGRFRRLKLLETVRLDLICLLTVSACILHNICLLNNDVLDDIEIDQNPHDDDIAREGVNEEYDNDNATYLIAVEKRVNIMNIL